METDNQQQNENSSLGAIKAFFWDFAKILAISLAIIIPFRLLVAEPFVVSGSSMLPNFHNNDYLIIDRISYRSNDPERGDAVVIKYPKDNRQYFIKRIIGLPGESIEFRSGKVYIINSSYPQGKELTENYLPSNTPTLGKTGPFKLGDGEYFVLGDNRTASSDSRVWGILPAKNIVGRVWVRVFPLGDFGFIKTPTYGNDKN